VNLHLSLGLVKLHLLRLLLVSQLTVSHQHQYQHLKALHNLHRKNRAPKKLGVIYYKNQLI
jgi:hypothetical protein